MAAVDVEDLPQMWEKPGYEALLTALGSLEVKPPIWNHRRRRSDIVSEQESLVSQHRASAARYLSSIIKSPLMWLEDDEQREAVWTLASRRMTERCGRMAMGEILRSWPISGGDNNALPPFELVIREPGLTGDDALGLKTWGSSYVLAQQLARLGASSLFRLFDESLGEPRPDVLELGAGTGLLGLAAAALWKVPVIMSDLPNIVPNLKENVARNVQLIEGKGGSVRVGHLTWGGSGEDEVDQTLFGQPNQFKIVLVADPLYDHDHPALLASAISHHLALGPEARAVVMVPLRDKTTRRLLNDFRGIMARLVTPPMGCDEEEHLPGQDDWSGGHGEEGGGVDCWLGIFSRRTGDYQEM